MWLIVWARSFLQIGGELGTELAISSGMTTLASKASLWQDLGSILTFDAPFLADLAGNAYSSTPCLAFCMATLASTPFSPLPALAMRVMTSRSALPCLVWLSIRWIRQDAIQTLRFLDSEATEA